MNAPAENDPQPAALLRELEEATLAMERQLHEVERAREELQHTLVEAKGEPLRRLLLGIVRCFVRR